VLIRYSIPGMLLFTFPIYC